MKLSTFTPLAFLIFVTSEASAMSQSFLNCIKYHYESNAGLLTGTFYDWGVDLDTTGPGGSGYGASCMYIKDSPDKIAPISSGAGPNSCGSSIDVIGRSLKEEIAIAGTPFSLVYKSSYGRRLAEYNKTILACQTPDAGGSLPDCRITFRAGDRQQSQTFVGQPENWVSFTWDGKTNNTTTAFFPTWASYTYDYLNLPSGLGFVSANAYVEAFLLGAYDSKFYGLGGWQFDVHHAYSTSSEIIYKGDGSYSKFKAVADTDGNLRVKLPDEDVVYIFSSNGRHLRTLTALLGRTIYSFQYDSAGRIISIVDGYGNTTTIQRSSSGSASSITAPFGQITTLSMANGLLASVKDPTNKTTSMTYFDTRGLLKSFARHGLEATQFQYDSLGYLVKDTNPTGRSLTYELTSESPTTIRETTATGLSSTIELYDSVDAIPSYTHYSPEGHITGTSTNGPSYHFISSPSGNRSTTREKDPRYENSYFTTNVSEASPYSQLNRNIFYTESYTLSNANNPFSVTQATFTQTEGTRVWTRKFTKANNTFEITSPVGRKVRQIIDDQENVIKISSSGLSNVNYSYNTFGQLTMASFGSRKTNYTYNSKGLVSAIKNPLGQTTNYAYNASGLVTSVTSPNQLVTKFSYDGRNNLVSVTPHSKPATLMSFNAFENLLAFTPPPVAGVTNSATRYEYDLDQRLSKITRPSGDTIQYQRVASTGKLEAILTPQDTLNYTLDSLGRPAEVSYKGINTSIQYDGLLKTQEYTYSFDQSGQGIFGFLNNTYNTDGTLATQKITDQNTNNYLVINYQYDADQKVIKAGPQLLSYDSNNGLLKSITNGNMKINYTHDSFGAVKTYSAVYGTNPIFSYTLTRDSLGRITQKTETVQGVTKTFAYTYDSSGRLKTVSENNVNLGNYNYDGNGNKTSGKINNIAFTASYDEQERLKTWNSSTYTYNANGELTGRTNSLTSVSEQFRYDVFGSLLSYKRGSTSITYYNDALKRRVGRGSATNINSRYIYDGPWKIVGEFKTDNKPKRIYGYASDAHSPDFYKEGSYFYQVLKDHLGSVRLVVKLKDGSVVQKINYNEWGKIVSSTGLAIQPLTFAGGLYDSTSGLMHFGARDYDPETGRWLSKDPILFAGGDTNLYGYVMNDPINLIDPNGKWAIPLAYLAFEGGFFLGATYNRFANGVPYSDTYRGANPILNLMDNVLPGSGFFLNPDFLNMLNQIYKRHYQGEKCEPAN